MQQLTLASARLQFFLTLRRLTLLSEGCTAQCELQAQTAE